MMAMLAAQYPEMVVYRTAAMYCAAQLGNVGQARSEFERLAQTQFAGLPSDQTFLIVLHQLTAVCAFLEDAPRAAQLAALLLPYETRAVAITTGGYLGPVPHCLGILEALQSQWEHASRHFEIALQMNTHMRARAEMEMLTDQLAGAVGRGGRDRPVGAAGERARVAVTKRVKEAIRRIGQVHPELAEHLKASITTGYFCAYVPMGTTPVWHL